MIAMKTHTLYYFDERPKWTLSLTRIARSLSLEAHSLKEIRSGPGLCETGSPALFWIHESDRDNLQSLGLWLTFEIQPSPLEVFLVTSLENIAHLRMEIPEFRFEAVSPSMPRRELLARLWRFSARSLSHKLAPAFQHRLQGTRNSAPYNVVLTPDGAIRQITPELSGLLGLEEGEHPGNWQTFLPEPQRSRFTFHLEQVRQYRYHSDFIEIRTPRGELIPCFLLSQSDRRSGSTHILCHLTPLVPTTSTPTQTPAPRLESEANRHYLRYLAARLRRYGGEVCRVSMRFLRPPQDERKEDCLDRVARTIREVDILMGTTEGDITIFLPDTGLEGAKSLCDRLQAVYKPECAPEDWVKENRPSFNIGRYTQTNAALLAMWGGDMPRRV